MDISPLFKLKHTKESIILPLKNNTLNTRLYIFILFCALQFQLIANVEISPSYTLPSYTDRDLEERIANMQNQVIKPRLDNVVRSYIKTYTQTKPKRTEEMIGRATIYFPMFEHHLREKNLPDDLKYLSVVESALNPQAVSRSGAVGLWQFMGPTASDFNLKMNSSVDERKDPNKSTLAAITYLERLHKKFGNWELALAAYNGGPGRVAKAVKRGKSHNFWKIQKLLPKETRNYVSAFISACYIMEYHEKHNLYPRYPEHDLQFTASTKIYSNLTFKKIAEVTGVPNRTIETLNPSYKRRTLPHSSKGNYLTLPQNALNTLLHFLGRPDTYVIKHSNYGSISAPHALRAAPTTPDRVIHYVNQHEDIYRIANIFSCSPEQIMKWNQLNSYQVFQGQKIVIEKKSKTSVARKKFGPLPDIKRLSIHPFHVKPKKPLLITNNVAKKKNRKKLAMDRDDRKNSTTHILKKGESLFQVATQYNDVTLKEIIRLNRFSIANQPKPGDIILIKLK